MKKTTQRTEGGTRPAKAMPDMQKRPDYRRIPISKVGVKDITYPIVVMDKKHSLQHTVARVNMYVDLPHQFKGTHMSRFVEILDRHRDQIALDDKLEVILREMKSRLGSVSAHLEIQFPYFIDKRAPVSGAKSLMEYTCEFSASMTETLDFVLGVRVPLTSLCPCSRELSDYGAHNQRSVMTVRVRYRDLIWIEDLVELIEQCGSSPLYSLLKREDEKYVTEQAYENPRFVEDMVREAYLRLAAIENITWFSVETENFESIHNHSAYAAVELDRRKPAAA